MLKLVQGICVCTLAASGLMAQTAVSLPPSAVGTTGMVALVQEQYAQFNVLNPGVLPPGAAITCDVVLTFLGADGGVLKTKTVNVGPGDSVSIQLHGVADLALAANVRKEIRATVSTLAVPANAATPTSAATVAPCHLIGTLEIVSEFTGATQFVLGGLHVVPSAPAVTASSSN